jgi:hypothetical protein
MHTREATSRGIITRRLSGQRESSRTAAYRIVAARSLRRAGRAADGFAIADHTDGPRRINVPPQKRRCFREVAASHLNSEQPLLYQSGVRLSRVIGVPSRLEPLGAGRRGHSVSVLRRAERSRTRRLVREVPLLLDRREPGANECSYVRRSRWERRAPSTDEVVDAPLRRSSTPLACCASPVTSSSERQGGSII